MVHGNVSKATFMTDSVLKVALLTPLQATHAASTARAICANVG